jgi:hypothetical protein
MPYAGMGLIVRDAVSPDESGSTKCTVVALETTGDAHKWQA